VSIGLSVTICDGVHCCFTLEATTYLRYQEAVCFNYKHSMAIWNTKMKFSQVHLTNLYRSYAWPVRLLFSRWNSRPAYMYCTSSETLDWSSSMWSFTGWNQQIPLSRCPILEFAFIRSILSENRQCHSLSMKCTIQTVQSKLCFLAWTHHFDYSRPPCTHWCMDGAIVIDAEI
jgi:hypothetical protein